MDRLTRMVVYGLLAFSGSFLLGESYLPSASYFWGLGSGRVLLCLLLFLLPGSDAGRFRPLVIGLAGACMLVTSIASPLIFTRWVFITILYLLLEVAIDALVLATATEQEVPLELGWLAGCRLSGLWLGLFLQHSSLVDKAEPHRLAGWLLLFLTIFWAVARESSGEQSGRRDISGGSKSLLLPLRELATPWSLGAIFALLCYAGLAGYYFGAILPYPLLHPAEAGPWMVSILDNLSILGVGLVGMALCERLDLKFQLLIASALTWALLLRTLLLSIPPPTAAGGFLLLAILLSSRAVLREAYRVDPVLRAAVVITAWTTGGLGGALLAGSVEARGGGTLLSLVAATGAALLAIAGWRRYNEKARMLLTPIPAATNQARFGDRTQDFEAAPSQSPGKRGARKWKRHLNYVLLRLPMLVITVALLLGGLKLGSYIHQQKADWDKTLKDTQYRFQTELFFHGFARRLQEDMIASQRVPSIWGEFISQSFSSQGKPLTDLDPWGTPYRIENHPTEVIIQSAGQDRAFGTPDDLEKSTSKPEGVK